MNYGDSNQELMHQRSSRSSTCVPPVTLSELWQDHLHCGNDHVALIQSGRQVTYAELDVWSNAIAHHLLQQGMQRGDLVAICLQRSCEFVASMLGIIKAGGAYVPLDKSYPQERLNFLLEDSRTEFIICSNEEAEQRLRQGLKTTSTDDLRRLSKTETTAAALPEISPHGLAYVIYTSGSTGRPKGVMIEHGAVANTIQEINRRFDVGPADRCLGLSSFSFDLSVYDVFGMLAAGGTLVMLEPRLVREPSHWAELLMRHGVTIWNSVPALMEMLHTYALNRPTNSLGSLRLTMLSGDWIPVSLPERIRLLAPRNKLVSLGGATEASIWSIAYEIDEVDPKWTSIPYGKPLTGQTFYILDSKRKPVPAGNTGELYIGGHGLARGYLHRPELTEERFVFDPFSQVSDRMYQTGDIGRMTADGNIEFQGRTDHQVKINGFRIELGEVERTLGLHPGVQNCVAASLGDRGRKRLIAYLVVNENVGKEVVSYRSVRSFLKTRLPNYMVPTQFVLLQKIPLSSNGKIDRGRLPEPNNSNILKENRNTEIPASPLELAIIKMWQQGFGVSQLGVHDNFFALGGDSIAAAGFFVQLENELGYSISLATLVQHPTIRELAGTLQNYEESDSGQQWEPLVSIRPQGNHRPLFCFPGIDGSVLPYRTLSFYLDAETPVFGLQPQGLCGSQMPRRRLRDVAESHISVMRGVQPEGPYALLGFSFGGMVAFEVARQLKAAGEEVDLLIIIDTPLRGRPWWWRAVRSIFNGRGSQNQLESVGPGTWFEGARSIDDLDFPPGRRKVMKTHQLALETYRLAKSETKLLYLHAMIRPPFPASLFDASPTQWIECGGPGSEANVVPGSHETLFMPGNIEAVAQQINRWLARREEPGN